MNGKSPLTNETLHQRQYKHTRNIVVSTISGGLNLTLKAIPGNDQEAMRLLDPHYVLRLDFGTNSDNVHEGLLTDVRRR